VLHVVLPKLGAAQDAQHCIAKPHGHYVQAALCSPCFMISLMSTIEYLNFYALTITVTVHTIVLKPLALSLLPSLSRPRYRQHAFQASCKPHPTMYNGHHFMS
jgi:hypothetical protein